MLHILAEAGFGAAGASALIVISATLYAEAPKIIAALHLSRGR